MHDGNVRLPYRMQRDLHGEQYIFYCELSGRVVAVLPRENGTPDVNAAWASTRPYFNRCIQCGKWVCDQSYNMDEMKCVQCAPFSGRPRFCTCCGSALIGGSVFCVNCGSRIE